MSSRRRWGSRHRSSAPGRDPGPGGSRRRDAPPAGRAGAAARLRRLPRRAPRARCGRRSRRRCWASKPASAHAVDQHLPAQAAAAAADPSLVRQLLRRGPPCGSRGGWFAGRTTPHRIVEQVDAVEVRAEQARAPGHVRVVEDDREVEVAALQRGHGRRAAHPRRGSARPPDAFAGTARRPRSRAWRRRSGSSQDARGRPAVRRSRPARARRRPAGQGSRRRARPAPRRRR